MSKSIVKKALEILDADDQQAVRLTKTTKKKTGVKREQTKLQDRKQLARTCSTLKHLSQPVVSADQIEQFNNYRFGGPSKRQAQLKKKKDKEEEIFTKEDFERFAREYNPPLLKS